MASFNFMNIALATMTSSSAASLSTAFDSLSSSQDSLELFEESLFQRGYQVPDDAIHQALKSEYASPLMLDILIGYGAAVSESDLQFALDIRKPDLLDSLLSSMLSQSFEDYGGIINRLLESLMQCPDRLSDDCLVVLLRRGLEITDRTFCLILDYGAFNLLLTLTDEGYRIPDISILQAIEQAPTRGLGPLRLLLKLGGNPNASSYGVSALKAAIQSPVLSVELTRLLVEYGAAVAYQDLLPDIRSRSCSSELIALLYGPVDTLPQTDQFSLMLNGLY